MTIKAPRSKCALGLALALAALGFAPRPAQACGGFFCNQPQNNGELPVAQTAENVLFSMTRTPAGRFELEAHVQIFYTGPADRFSWVVPVDNKPELDVGSDFVFTRLLATTRPTFDVTWHEEGTCREIPSQPKGGGIYPTAPGDRSAPPQLNPGGSGPAPAPPGVDVSFRGDVGPYDAAVIKSTDPSNPKPLLDWLAENKYFVSPDGERLIADYVREDKYFVAIRLLSGQDTKQIQPLVMRFEGPGPCIPLRLTAIAALNDLQINLWVLAESRVVPENFFEIQINEAALDWLGSGAGKSYDELVKRAANEAGGNAFATDYSGPADLLKGQLFQPGQFRLDDVARATTPPDALDLIGRMPFPRDNRLMDVLRKYIPEPEVLKQMKIDERQFYNQLRTYWVQYQEHFAPFDAAALAAELDRKFVSPLRRAQELFDRSAKLTRLTTFISPEEMTVDPTFLLNPTLPPVPLRRTAKAVVVCGDKQFTRCDAPLRLEMPGGSTLWLMPKAQTECQPYDTRAQAYQEAVVTTLPALHIGWRRDALGAGVPRFDNQTRIQQALSRNNDRVKAYARNEAYSGGVFGECGCHLGSARSRWAGGGAAGLLIAGVALLVARRRRR